MKRILFTLSFLLVLSSSIAQINLDYQKPPEEILDLVDVPLAPRVVMNSDGDIMLLLYRDSYKDIATLSEEELRLGGLRINPKTNIGSRVTYFNNIKIKGVEEKKDRQISGLPNNPKLSNFSWSPDESKMAFTHTIDTAVEIWILDLATANVSKLTTPPLNANMGNPIHWFKDGNSLLVNVIPDSRKPLINTEDAVPTGPTISTSDGSKAQNRTYQDLLQNPNDVFNFEQLATSSLMKLDLNGKISLWKEAAMYSGISLSPDGKYWMMTTLEKPFSYIVPYRRFPQTSVIYNIDGTTVKEVNKVPLVEELPKGFMAARKGKRSMQWRSDKPATLVWAEVLDNGDPDIDVAYRDQVYMQDAPFTKEPQKVLKTIGRFSGIQWGNDNTALAYDYWWNTRNTKTYLFDPSSTSNTGKIIADRNYQDVYSDPGSFVTNENKYGRNVLTIENNELFLIGDGYSKKGQFPFIDAMNLKTGKTKRIYESSYTDKLENLQSAIDMKKGEILVRIESSTEYPNYYIRDIKKDKLTQISDFENPFASIQDIHKEVITYKRDDGLELSGTLYLPVGYDNCLLYTSPSPRD